MIGYLGAIQPTNDACAAAVAASENLNETITTVGGVAMALLLIWLIFR